MPFKQNSDLFYLTGVDQVETLLVLIPDSVDTKARVVLFVKETSKLIAAWEGEKSNLVLMHNIPIEAEEFGILMQAKRS
jgi:Xaa-Pro aminopeptidase